MHLFQQYGFFAVIVALFISVGVGMFINIVWGLLTGGPRAKNAPGAPYLYDRVYYLLFLFAMVGWSVGLLSVLGGEENSPERGFIVGWGILAIGMGTLFWSRRDMMLRGSTYLSKHGFWLWRFFDSMQAMQFSRLSTTMQRFVGPAFVVAGIAALAINFLYIPSAFQQAALGAKALVGIITAR